MTHRDLLNDPPPWERKRLPVELQLMAQEAAAGIAFVRMAHQDQARVKAMACRYRTALLSSTALIALAFGV